MASISIEKVSKVYPNGFQAVDELNFEVAEGEFMVMVGPSGCGKTTALRMVAGLEEISSGTLRIGDQVANNLTSKERDVAMVFQNYALYPHMSVEQNIAFGLSLRKTPKRRDQAEGRGRGRASSASPICCSRSPDSCRAGSANGWRWDARSFANRRSS